MITDMVGLMTIASNWEEKTIALNWEERL